MYCNSFIFLYRESEKGDGKGVVVVYIYIYLCRERVGILWPFGRGLDTSGEEDSVWTERGD